MKNLHRKISAMLLAGMVVFGGVAVSGVSSFAASSEQISVKKSLQEINARKVKNIVGMCGYNVVSVNNNGKEIDKIAKEKYAGIKYQKSSGSNLKNPYQIPLNLNNSKRYGYGLVKVLCQDVYYLIKLN